MNTKIKVNKIIFRKNYLPFKGGFPVIRIKSANFIESGAAQKHFRVNGQHIINAEAVDVISEERAEELIALWNSLVISPANGGGHFRTDNGEPKAPLGSDGYWKEVLFQYILKYPQNKYNVYLCPECDCLHLGKVV